MPSVSTTQVLGACLLSFAIGASISYYYAMDLSDKEHVQKAEVRHKKDMEDARTRHTQDMHAAEKRRLKDVQAADTRRQREIKFLELTLEKQREIIRSLRERPASPNDKASFTSVGQATKVAAPINNLVKQ